MSDVPAVETESLVKRYAEVTALAGLGLSIPSGIFFGLLGPNGAGKTTAVSILCTLLQPTSGQAHIFGYDVLRERRQVRACLGIVFQEPSLDTELTGRENLDLHARLYHLDDRDSRVRTALDLMGMHEAADRPARSLSGGERRRLEIARGMLHEPRILFLDEPTLGLDVHARRALWDHLDRLRSRGLTLVLTTHAMDEAERLCDEVAVLNEGRVVATGSPRQLAQSVGGDHVEFELEDATGALARVRESGTISRAELREGALVLTVENAPKQLVALVELLKPFDIHAVRMREANLEDAFVHLSGRSIDASGNLE